MSVIGQFGEVEIREFLSSDVDSLVRRANDPRIAVTLRDRFPQPYLHEHAEGWIEFSRSQNPILSYALADSTGVIGGIGLEPMADVYSHSAEVGYWLATEYWGRGIMSRVLARFTEYAFANFDFTRIHAHVFSSNPASARVLEKAGYQREGTMRGSVIKAGAVLDQWLYAALQDEWRNPS